MNLISISTDRKIFDPKSPAAGRMRDYATLVDQLHIIVFAPKSFRNTIQLAPNVWVYPTRSLSRWLYVLDGRRMARNLIRKNNFSPTTTIVSTQDPFETGLVGVFLKRHFGFRMQVQAHTDFLSPYFIRHSFLNRIRVRIARWVLMNASQVRVVSKRIKDSIEKNFSFVPVERIDILPIYSDISRFEKPADPALREKYSRFPTIILMSSRLTPEKNIPLALRAFKKSEAGAPSTGLVIVGDGPEKNRLATLAQNLGIAERVVFEPWTDDIAPYYKIADIFLSTSLYEGYGLTLIEAAASGTAIVATNVGIAGDLLIDGKNARICAINDENGVAKALQELVSMPAVRQDLAGQAARDIKGLAVSKERYMQKYKELLEKTLHEK